MYNFITGQYQILRDPSSPSVPATVSTPLPGFTAVSNATQIMRSIATPPAAVIRTQSQTSAPLKRKILKPSPLGVTQVTATQELYELAIKKGLTVKFKFIEPYNFEFKPNMSKEEMRGNYKVQLQVGTMEFMGHADLPHQAKHNSAVQALPYLHQIPDIKVIKSTTISMEEWCDTRHAAMLKPYKLSDELAEIVGQKETTK